MMIWFGAHGTRQNRTEYTLRKKRYSQLNWKADMEFEDLG